MYTASTALLEALSEWGVEYVFANFGSDHPALIEAIAEARAHGRSIPTIVTSPNEMVALSCAHGYAQVSGRAQAVLVHVECGTQALGGAVHNAARARVPVFIFAGMSPFTQDGELKGSRNEFIQWIQDVHDQRGIVRGYMKYDNEFRTGANIKQVVYRAMQIGQSDPKGPVYLVGAREVMEEEAKPAVFDRTRWMPLAAQALPEDGVAEIVTALAAARHPLVVTSYVGRRPEAVAELVRLCNSLGIGVLESVPSAANFPHDSPLYQGNHWNHPFQNQALAEADVVLVIDSDVPWIPTINRPSPQAAIYHIDVDPLKENMPLWHIEARRSFRADATMALQQLNARVVANAPDVVAVRTRAEHFGTRHAERAATLTKQAEPAGGVITPEYLTVCVRRQIGADAIVMNEGITNYPAICDHIAPTVPGHFFASGGGSLGWAGGAAIGAKLAAPEKTVVTLTGDGSYMFSIPSTVHWMARQYKTPFLQVVYNNRGWKAPKYSALAVHPDGYASRANEIDVAFDPPPDYAGIAAAAGGAFARTVKQLDEVEDSIGEALRVVRNEGRAAVLDVWLPRL
ncbi:MAG TPA: thiamine pyrophosphate-requiring protein [Bauldia sp.]